jgi:hypothetical protein
MRGNKGFGDGMGVGVWRRMHESGSRSRSGDGARRIGGRERRRCDGRRNEARANDSGGRNRLRSLIQNRRLLGR